MLESYIHTMVSYFTTLSIWDLEKHTMGNDFKSK